MTNPRKSKKQRANALEGEQAEMRVAFEAECAEVRELMFQMGLENQLELDDCVDRRMNDWEQNLPYYPSGRYQDKQRIVAEYQKHFVMAVQEFCPEVFDELRELVPLFKRLFGSDIDGFHRLFDIRLGEFLNHKGFEIGNSINADLDPYIQFGIFGPNFERFSNDYRVGQTKGVLIILRTLFDSINSNKLNAEWTKDAIEFVRANLVFNPHKVEFPEFDCSLLPPYLDLRAKKVVFDIQTSGFGSYTTRHAREWLVEFLTSPEAATEPDVEAFIELQLALFEWAKRHNLEKDWLLRYAYFVISRFSNDQSLIAKAIELPVLNLRSLIALPFEFKFEGWESGEERREDYEKRLKQGFENQLIGYFQDTSSFLNLQNIKSVSKPKDFERVKWLVCRTVRGWDSERIVEKFFPIESADRTKSERDNKTFENKKKNIENQMRDLKTYDLPYRTTATP